MKKKLTLSIDADLMENINQKAKLNKNINLSKMVENFLFDQFMQSHRSEEDVTSLRGLIKEKDYTEPIKDERYERIKTKHVK